jgi:dienelactone hydrolase
MRRHGFWRAAPIAVLAAACSGSSGSLLKPDAGSRPDGGPGSDGGGPVTALFSTTPADFYELPFPNDLRLKPDGTMDLSDYPRPNEFLGNYFDIFAANTRGFGTNSAIYFRFSGPIDPATLPATPEDSLADGASVYLAEVATGAKVPLRFRFETAAQSTIGPNWLACLPFPGFPLKPATKYIAVVTSRVKGQGGSPVLAAAAARQTYGAMMPADAVNATVFTTQDPVSLMAKLRQAVYLLDEPQPEAPPTPGPGDVGALEWDGTYLGPNYQSGDVPYLTTGGQILVDDNGMPKLQRMESIRFAVTVPSSGTMPANGWPIVIYAHGTGGSYRDFIEDGTARRLAAQGVAAISIDQVLHGPRDPTGHDPNYTFFNFQNPLGARDNVRQGALDDFQLLRLAVKLDVAGNHFDASKIGFFGHSQGGLTGPLFLAAEPRVTGAVLSGAGGLAYISLLEKTEPVNIPGYVAVFIHDLPLDEFNPILNMVQMYLEPADPTNYGPLLVMHPMEGVAPKNIYQSEGFIDHATPDPGIEAFGVSMGLSPVSPIMPLSDGFALRGSAPLMPAVSGNENGVSGVLAQYLATHGEDGHYVVFHEEAAMRQSIQFLSTLANSQTGVATLVP